MFVQSTWHIVIMLYKHLLNECRSLTMDVKISWGNGDDRYLEDAGPLSPSAGHIVELSVPFVPMKQFFWFFQSGSQVHLSYELGQMF